MQFAGRGADGRPIVICAEKIEQIKHLDNYKILTTLLTQKGNKEEKTFDGYATTGAKYVGQNGSWRCVVRMIYIREKYHSDCLSVMYE